MPAIEPLANIVANYACYDGQQEVDDGIQFAHLPLLPDFFIDEKSLQN
jgi:hypothetical protein